MFKKHKIKLSTLTVCWLSIILISLTVTLSVVSVKSIASLGDHAIQFDHKHTREDAMIFFLEIARRTTESYSNYFAEIANLLNILSNQVRNKLLEIPDSPQKKNGLIKINKCEKHDLSIEKTKKNYSAFYFGNENYLLKAKQQIDKFSSLLPLFNDICNGNIFFDCLWIITSDQLQFQYPHHHDFTKNSKEASITYFNNIFSEFPKNNKDKQPKSGVIWDFPYKDLSGELNIGAYKHIFDNKGDFLASVGIDMEFERTANGMVSTNLFADYHKYDLSGELKSTRNKMKGFIFIVDKNGYIIVFPNKYSSLLSLPKMEYSMLKEYPDKLKVNLKDSRNKDIKQLAKDIKNNDIGITTIKLMGEYYLIAFNNIESTSWSLCFTIREKPLMLSATKTKTIMGSIQKEMHYRFIAIAVFFLLLFILIAIFTFRFFHLNPLQKIRNKVKKIGEGDFNITLDETGVAEIAELASTFNVLTRELKEYTQNLENEVKARQTINTELEIAGKLQNSVLPKITEEFIRKEFDFYTKLIPAKEMSGDFYDFFYLKKDILGIVMADVSGKGITAAFYMSMAKVIIKEACLTAENLDTGKVCEKVNHILSNSVKTPMFLTMYLMFYNIKTGKIIYTNAGHHDFLKIDQKGQVSCMGAKDNDLIIGFVDDHKFSSKEFYVEPNDTIILYTDGITEAIDSNDIFFGEEKLIEIVKENATSNINKIGETIVQEVLNFQSGSKFDDITCVILKRNF